MTDQQYITVENIEPGKTKISLIIKVLKVEVTPWQQDKGENFTGQGGDETGVINFNFRGKHTDIVKEGAVINLSNVNCQVYDSRMRLIDIFGQSSITRADSTLISSVKTSNDLSLDEYELLEPADDKRKPKRESSQRESDKRRGNYNNNDYRDRQNNQTSQGSHRNQNNSTRRYNNDSRGYKNDNYNYSDNRGSQNHDNKRNYNNDSKKENSRSRDRDYGSDNDRTQKVRRDNQSSSDRTQRNEPRRDNNRRDNSSRDGPRRDQNNEARNSRPKIRKERSSSQSKRKERDIDENDNKHLKNIANLVPHPDDFITVEAKIQKITEKNEKGVGGVLGDSTGIVNFYFVSQAIPENVDLNEGDVVRVVEGKCKVYDEHAYISVAGGILRKCSRSDLQVNEGVNVSSDTYGKKIVSENNPRRERNDDSDYSRTQKPKTDGNRPRGDRNNNYSNQRNQNSSPRSRSVPRNNEKKETHDGPLIPKEPTFITINKIRKTGGFNIKAKVINLEAKEKKQGTDSTAFVGQLGDSTGLYDFYFRQDQLPKQRNEIRKGDVLEIRNASTRVFKADSRFYIFIDMFGKVLFSDESIDVDADAQDFSVKRAFKKD